MKMNKRHFVNPDKIHSLEDLRMEKLRLQMEILRSEERIHEGYRSLLEAFSLKNLASTMISEFETTSTVFSKAFDIGKSFMAKRKKKKGEKHKDQTNPETA